MNDLYIAALLTKASIYQAANAAVEDHLTCDECAQRRRDYVWDGCPAYQVRRADREEAINELLAAAILMPPTNTHGVETLTCCACHDEDVYDSRVEAKAEGWVRARGTWTCPACADEWREESQTAYEQQWGPGLAAPSGYGSVMLPPALERGLPGGAGGLGNLGPAEPGCPHPIDRGLDDQPDLDALRPGRPRPGGHRTTRRQGLLAAPGGDAMSERGTTNGNARGSAEDRRRWREWLVATYAADVQLGGLAACRCYRCGRLLTVLDVTVDRIVPGCQGGTYRRTNIRPACAHCNSATGGATRGKR